MRKSLLACGMAVLAAGLFLGACQSNTQQQEENTDAAADAVQTEALNVLTEAETAEGWKLLFNGTDLSGWHSYRRDTLSGWTVQDGAIARVGGGGDLITDQEFDNYELAFEWKISPKGNSGVMYNVVEDAKYADTYATGPEYQVIDNAYEQPLTDAQKAGGNYDMHPPSEDATKPVGEWNQSRIVINGNQVEHWLNGVKVVAYEMYSDDWKKRMQASKWKEFPGYATGEKGRIALQDHGNDVWYRNIKIREL